MSVATPNLRCLAEERENINIEYRDSYDAVVHDSLFPPYLNWCPRVFVDYVDSRATSSIPFMIIFPEGKSPMTIFYTSGGLNRPALLNFFY